MSMYVQVAGQGTGMPYMPQVLIPFGIHLIRRPKIGNPSAWHYGLMVNCFGFPVAYDLQQDLGPRQISLQDFEDGQEAFIVKSLSAWPDIQVALARLQHAKIHMAVWRLFDNNCEHFAEYVMTGVKKSEQVDSLKWVAGVAGIVLAIFLIGKAGGSPA